MNNLVHLRGLKGHRLVAGDHLYPDSLSVNDSRSERGSILNNDSGHRLSYSVKTECTS